MSFCYLAGLLDNSLTILLQSIDLRIQLVFQLLAVVAFFLQSDLDLFDHLVKVVDLVRLVVPDFVQSSFKLDQNILDFLDSRGLLLVHSVLQVAYSLEESLDSVIVVVSVTLADAFSAAVSAHSKICEIFNSCRNTAANRY